MVTGREEEGEGDHTMVARTLRRLGFTPRLDIGLEVKHCGPSQMLYRSILHSYLDPVNE